MDWNIMWHQAITRPLLKVLLSKKEQTAGFHLPVTHNGTKLRLHLVNQNGKSAYKVGGLCAIYDDKLYPLTVRGQSAFEIPTGTSLYTDELALSLRENADLELRIYYKNKFDDVNSIEEEAVVYNGDATRSIEAQPLPRQDWEVTYGMYKAIPAIDRVEILTEETQKTIVAFGDSITAMSRWVKPLAKRLRGAYGSAYTLVNSGIGGNCLTYHPKHIFAPSFGMMGTRRYQRDVLDIPHVHAVILAFGINDIRFMTPKSEKSVNEKLLIGETARMAELFRSKGIRVVCQTLGPRMVTEKFTDEMEQIRKRYNEWVRTCGLFDYVVDVEPKLLEPATTDTIKNDLHMGDHLHPNAQGGQVMADCYDLEKLTGEAIRKQ